MAAEGASEMTASLALVQAAGALSLDIQADADADKPASAASPTTSPSTSPCPVSPWAGSTYSCGSPWSPVTPAVIARGTGDSLNRFGMAVGPMPAEAERHAVLAQPTSTQVAAGIDAASAAKAMTTSAAAGAGTATTIQGLRLPIGFASATARAPAVTKVQRVSFAASPCHSPVSPGAQIRRNAANLGIPLNLRAATGEVSAPVPVRSALGSVVAPSPTARVPAHIAAGGACPAAGGALSFGALSAQGAAAQPPGFLRSIVTPLTGASRPRRAAGGA